MYGQKNTSFLVTRYISLTCGGERDRKQYRKVSATKIKSQPCKKKKKRIKEELWVSLWISGCGVIPHSLLQLGNYSLQGVNPHGVKPCCVQKENPHRDSFFFSKSSYSTFWLRGKKPNSYPKDSLKEKYLAYIAWRNVTKGKKIKSETSPISL